MEGFLATEQRIDSTKSSANCSSTCGSVFELLATLPRTSQLEEESFANFARTHAGVLGLAATAARTTDFRSRDNCSSSSSEARSLFARQRRISLSLSCARTFATSIGRDRLAAIFFLVAFFVISLMRSSNTPGHVSRNDMSILAHNLRARAVPLRVAGTSSLISTQPWQSKKRDTRSLCSALTLSSFQRSRSSCSHSGTSHFAWTSAKMSTTLAAGCTFRLRAFPFLARFGRARARAPATFVWTSEMSSLNPELAAMSGASKSTENCTLSNGNGISTFSLTAAGISLLELNARFASARTQVDLTDSCDHSTTTAAALRSSSSITRSNSSPVLISRSHQTSKPASSRWCARDLATGRSSRA